MVQLEEPGDLLQGLESLLPWGQEQACLRGLGAAPWQGDAQGLGALQQLGLVLILPLGLALALSSELPELALWLEMQFCQSLLQSLGAGEEDVSGSLLRDVCSVSGSLPQTKGLSFRSGISTPKLGSLLWTRRLHSERTVCAPGRLCWEGGTRSLSQNRGWEIFIGFGWHLSPPCKPICLRRRRPPGIATQDLHIQQHTPTPSFGTVAHGPAPPPPPPPSPQAHAGLGKPGPGHLSLGTWLLSPAPTPL